MRSLEVYLIQNGKKIDIRNLNESQFDALRDCIHEFIPKDLKFVRDSTNDFGKLFDMNDEQFRVYKNLVYKIESERVLENEFNIYFKNNTLSQIKMWQNILKPIECRKKRKYCCSKCKIQGHNKRNKLKHSSSSTSSSSSTFSPI